MAELDRLDELLRGSLTRAAQPGDPSGVADAIRARVASGDTGTPAPSGSAPGFGSGPGSWLPWVGAILVLGLVGGTLGVTGVFGRPAASAAVSDAVLTSVGGSVDAGVHGLSCPSGPPITELQPGQHVVALARTADSSQIEVRDPAALDETVWVTARALRSLGDRFSSLPLSGCGVLASTPIPAPVAPVTPVTPPAPVKPGKPSNPGQPAPTDTTAPTEGAPTVAPQTVNCEVQVSVSATDDVGVASVSISWSGNNVGSGQMTHGSGSTWTYHFAPQPAYSGNTNFTVVAHDAVGNASAPHSVTFSVQCLI